MALSLPSPPAPPQFWHGQLGIAALPWRRVLPAVRSHNLTCPRFCSPQRTTGTTTVVPAQPAEAISNSTIVPPSRTASLAEGDSFSGEDVGVTGRDTDYAVPNGVDLLNPTSSPQDVVVSEAEMAEGSGEMDDSGNLAGIVRDKTESVDSPKTTGASEGEREETEIEPESLDNSDTWMDALDGEKTAVVAEHSASAEPEPSPAATSDPEPSAEYQPEKTSPEPAPEEKPLQHPESDIQPDAERVTQTSSKPKNELANEAKTVAQVSTFAMVIVVVVLWLLLH